MEKKQGAEEVTRQEGRTGMQQVSSKDFKRSYVGRALTGGLSLVLSVTLAGCGILDKTGDDDGDDTTTEQPSEDTSGTTDKSIDSKKEIERITGISDEELMKKVVPVSPEDSCWYIGIYIPSNEYDRSILSVSSSGVICGASISDNVLTLKGTMTKAVTDDYDNGTIVGPETWEFELADDAVYERYAGDDEDGEATYTAGNISEFAPTLEESFGIMLHLHIGADGKVDRVHWTSS